MTRSSDPPDPQLTGGDRQFLVEEGAQGRQGAYLRCAAADAGRFIHGLCRREPLRRGRAHADRRHAAPFKRRRRRLLGDLFSCGVCFALFLQRADEHRGLLLVRGSDGVRS